MSFTWNKTTITARDLTIADDDTIMQIVGKIESGIMNSGRPFAEYMIGATVEGEPPIPQIGRSASKEEVNAAYAAWLKLPRRFMRAWEAELAKAEAAPNG